MKDQFEQSMWSNECPNPSIQHVKKLTKEDIKKEIEFIIYNRWAIINI